MSKVVITLDTVKGDLNIVADGETLENVSSVSAVTYNDYEDEKKVSVSISLVERPADKGGLAKYTQLCAAENGDGSLQTVKTEVKPVHASIDALLTHYRNR